MELEGKVINLHQRLTQASISSSLLQVNVTVIMYGIQTSVATFGVLRSALLGLLTTCTFCNQAIKVMIEVLTVIPCGDQPAVWCVAF